ncbi:MAG: hypothetical protein HOG76_03230 [Candidatus Marinimicrobia bacterium]|jgi:hypothetical protein|nr:hypothetical protein [Candidatus Neomarinimicrobiota bacterium]MBT3630904.1 hypothetical protein [Candidatus Neomarinimicrobiota bacterium]MBT4421379.1 hypothetical protein [Candidatus Neomarinimicrobiota bacterium]MBT4993913.1 hypothetical protein [Candidatus Neomarinimicrobiota bacterium]MBT5314039.1 hypothetical protein [Candidatus Neomarinimicrobiota bacterium]
MNVPEKQHRRRKKSKRFERSIIREFSAEIMIGIIFFFGIFLLYEEMEIKTYVFEGVVSDFQYITHGISHFMSTLLGRAEEYETSDIVGSTLIFIAFNLLISRIRQKSILILSELTECPECGDDLVLVHRNVFQRIYGFVFRVKIRRFHCQSCDYDGLRVRSPKSI